MGIEPYLVAATLQGVLAQRLVRLLCPACAEPDQPEAAMLATRPAVRTEDAARWRRPRGCPACAGSGYRGRSGLFELFVPSEAIKARLAQGATLGDLRRQAAAEGLETLRETGWRLAETGRTSIAEVVRVTTGDEG
jgi:type II secretory ATPase GspE/PulE/Tfp pilus assembly ATPase PilB-like protein